MFGSKCSDSGICSKYSLGDFMISFQSWGFYYSHIRQAKKQPYPDLSLQQSQLAIIHKEPSFNNPNLQGQSQPPVMEKTWHQIKSSIQGCILATSSSIPSIQCLLCCQRSNLFMRPDLQKLERGLVLHKYPSYSRNTSSSGLEAFCLNCLLILPQFPCSLWQRSLLHLFSISPNSDKDVRTD